MNFPTKKYSIIYADPPWEYKESGSGNRVVHSKYPTMSLYEIKNLPVKPISKDTHCVLMSPIQEHSKKPREIRDLIIKSVGDLPRIELFARQKVDGWDAWGNEVEYNLFNQETKAVANDHV